jgi:hypothetical protein
MKLIVLGKIIILHLVLGSCSYIRDITLADLLIVDDPSKDAFQSLGMKPSQRFSEADYR